MERNGDGGQEDSMKGGEKGTKEIYRKEERKGDKWECKNKKG